MASRKAKTPAKQVNPIVAEFQQCCKVLNFTEEDVIADYCSALNHSETQIRLSHRSITPALGKVLLRLFQRYTRLQTISLCSCLSLDPTFLKQLSTDLIKSPVTTLCLDYAPVQRDVLVPFLSLPTLETLSLRGNQCLTSYDYVSHQWFAFPETLNMFFNSLATSQLKVLNLHGCHIGDDGAVALSSTLYFNTSLRAICLSRNRIGDVGARAIASALSVYVLSEAEISIVDRLMSEESKQRVSDEGSSLVKRKKGAKAPPKKPPPKTSRKGQQSAKSLSDRVLSFSPAAPVMPAILAKWNACVSCENGTKILPGNTTVTTIMLDENHITRTGYHYLSEMLKVNTKIVHFSMSRNPEIEEEKCEEISRRLPDRESVSPVQ